MSYGIDRALFVVLSDSLAAAMVLGSGLGASAAGGCIEKPNLHANQAGHWYYHVDRAHHRRCWYVGGSEGNANAPSRPEQTPSANADFGDSWLSRLATALGQPFSTEPQQGSVPENASSATSTVSQTHRRANRIAKKDRPRIESISETNGLAGAERGGQPPSPAAAERSENQGPQLTPADRDALFKQFMEWYVDRSMLARP